MYIEEIAMLIFSIFIFPWKNYLKKDEHDISKKEASRTPHYLRERLSPAPRNYSHKLSGYYRGL